MEPTGYSVPPSEGTSLNTSGTSGTLSSGPHAVVPPAKRYAPSPAAPAASAPPRDTPTVLVSSSDSGVGSTTTSIEKVRRLALVKARRETIRQELALAKADEEVAEEELRETISASAAGSVARLADVESEGGNSARARSRSSHELVILPPLPLVGIQENLLGFPTPASQTDLCGPSAKVWGPQPRRCERKLHVPTKHYQRRVLPWPANN